MTRGLYVPHHYVPNAGMTDEELLQIAGITDMNQFWALHAVDGTTDPSVMAQEQRERPVPTLMNHVPDLPLHPVDQQALDRRIPDIDFVPEGVTDPRVRARMRRRIEAREEHKTKMWRRSNQAGGTVGSLSPGQAATVLTWYNEDDYPLDVNVQLAWTLAGTIPAPQIGDVIALYARVEWGGGNAQNLAFCDFQTGTQLRLTASFVRISALYQPSNLPTPWPAQPDQLVQGSGGILTGPNVAVTAVLGRGFPTFRTSAARFTRKFTLPGFGNLNNDPIPPFASAFGFITSNPTTTLTFTLAQSLSDSGTGLGSFTSTVNPQPDNQFPIAQGYRFLSVHNGNAGGLGTSIIYALML